jgi:hypothetical protein
MLDYGFGQSEIAWGDAYCDEANVRRICQGIKDIGGSRLRFVVAWDQVDKIGQPYNWVFIDRAVDIAVDEYGLIPLLVMSVGLGRGGDGSAVAYGKLCKAAAERYGPQGSNKVDAYEIWNEENWSTFFTPTTPAAYTEMLKQAYTAIKSVHSSATVITGGTVTFITWSGPVFAPIPPFFATVTTVAPSEWVAGIYAAGGANYFDAVGYHWYSATGASDGAVQKPEDGQFDWEELNRVRDVMVDKGDAAKKVWITEMGFGSAVSLTTARDWLKLQIDMMAAEDWFGPPFIYCYRNTSSDQSNFIHTYGVVDFNYQVKSPYYDYVATLHDAPEDPGDIEPPDAPTGLSYDDVTSTTAALTWEPAADNVGVTNYRVYNLADVKVADTASANWMLTGLLPGTPQGYYVTAVDAAGNESDPSDSVEFTTDAPTGEQAFYQYDFTPTGSTLPMVFSQLGLGFSVSSGVALHSNSTSNGEFFTVAPYTLDQASPDHSSRIAQSTASAHPDRAALALARMSQDGSQFVAAGVYGGGQADACRIFTFDGGVVTLRDARNTAPLLPTEWVEIVAAGNIYTAYRVAEGTIIEELAVWTDMENVYSGAANRRAGIGWHHKRVHGINYPAPGITGLWRSQDISAVQPSGGVSDAWVLGIVDDEDWPDVIATNLWQIAI